MSCILWILLKVKQLQEFNDPRKGFNLQDKNSMSSENGSRILNELKRCIMCPKDEREGRPSKKGKTRDFNRPETHMADRQFTASKNRNSHSEPNY